MLQSLKIENYALIHALEIRFDKGFVVITGETGAGKSILIGALALILGNRADTDVLYDKSRKCIVEGVFHLDNPEMQTFFEQHDLDYQETTIIRREINEHGKSRAFINDTPVNLTTLKALTSQLIDIHSQHQNLLLQDSGFQMDIIDQYAQTQSLLASYKSSLAELKNTILEEKRLKEACSQAALEHDFHTFTIQEIENAQLQSDEQELLEQTLNTLTHAGDIKAHLYQAAQLLSEQDEDNILLKLKEILNECRALSDIGPEYSELCDRLESAQSELQDIAYEISRKYDAVDVNPQEMERVQERLDLIYTLEHKYQVDNIQRLLDILSKLQRESEAYQDNRELLATLANRIDELRATTQDLARQLSERRRNVLNSLSADVEARLVQLGMSDAKFEILLTDSGELMSNGADRVEYRFSANRGSAPADLGKVASGGELSRVMLALKSIITDSRLLPTVIFDEIDTGISGETANRVGEVMRLLAENHQVVTITHLPQIAVRGNQHLLVYKENTENQTITNIRQLDGDARVRVIASMLSGNEQSEAALTTAREMLHDTITKPLNTKTL
jgi:DNA repair protein RecN (Recombination protein N)